MTKHWHFFKKFTFRISGLSPVSTIVCAIKQPTGIACLLIPQILVSLHTRSSFTAKIWSMETSGPAACSSAGSTQLNCGACSGFTHGRTRGSLRGTTPAWRSGRLPSCWSKSLPTRAVTCRFSPYDPEPHAWADFCFFNRLQSLTGYDQTRDKKFTNWD